MQASKHPPEQSNKVQASALGKKAIGWKIGPVELLEATGELVYENQRASLTPKSMSVLLELVNAAPAGVTRLDILDAVWPNADVNDAIVTDAVRSLRRAFREVGFDKQLIITMPRIGYRLDANPSRLFKTPDPPKSHRNQPSIWPLLIVFIMALAVVVGFLDPFSETPELSNSADIHASSPYYSRGRAFYERVRADDNDKAIEVFQAGIQAHPDDPLLMSGLAEAYIREYEAFGGSADLAREAIQLAMKSVALGPELSAAQRAAGLASATAGNFGLARNYYRAAIQLDSENRQAIGNLAYLLLIERKISEAWPLLLKSHQLDRSDPRGHMFIAMALAEVGEFKLARSWFESAIALQLTAGEDRAEYMRMLAYLGETDRLLELLEEQVLDGSGPDLRNIAYSFALAGIEESAAHSYELLFESSGAEEVYLDEAAARWISLGIPPQRDDDIRHRVRSSIEAVLARESERRDQPDYLHEIAIRMLALNRVDEALLWLNRAVESGWINHFLTRAEPAMYKALKKHPDKFTAVLHTMKKNQDLARAALLNQLREEDSLPRFTLNGRPKMP